MQRLCVTLSREFLCCVHKHQPKTSPCSAMRRDSPLKTYPSASPWPLPLASPRPVLYPIGKLGNGDLPIRRLIYRFSERIQKVLVLLPCCSGLVRVIAHPLVI